MTYGLILIPLISAFIGWLANRVAIKMLFHPKQPKKILWFTLQGIFPKKQQAFAEKLGKLVSGELLSFRDITEKITDPDNIKKVMPQIEEHIDQFLKVKLPAQMPVISMFIGDRTINELKAVFITELETLFPVIMQQYMHNLENDLDLEKIVTGKVARFSSDKLEEILIGTMLKEFRFVEIIGGIMGFLIGLLQVLITLAQ